MEHQGWRVQRRPGADASMDLVAADCSVLESQAATNIAQLLLRLEDRFEIQPAESCALTAGAFESGRVADATTEHLESAADADELAAVAQMVLQVSLPASCAKPRQVRADVLRTR